MVKTIALVWAQNLLGNLCIVSAIAALHEILNLYSKEEMKQQCERMKQERYEREKEMHERGEASMLDNQYLLDIFIDGLLVRESEYWSEWQRKREKRLLLILLTVVLKVAQLCLVGILAV